MTDCTIKILSQSDISFDSVEAFQYPCKQRRYDYLLSRTALQQAFLEKNINYQFNIEGFKSGIIPPQGWLASISHTSTYAAAIIAPQGEYSAVGIDIENLSRPVHPKLFDRITTQEERKWINQDPKKLIQVFSAKETAYKIFSARLKKFSYKTFNLEWQSDHFVCQLEDFETIKIFLKQHELDHCLTYATNRLS